jgi:hypothetical protein
VIISGSGFERGAVILLNGEERKTRFVSATSLIGKKLLKSISRGQHVLLRVRNPNGETSPDASFTRPQ